MTKRLILLSFRIIILCIGLHFRSFYLNNFFGGGSLIHRYINIFELDKFDAWNAKCFNDAGSFGHTLEVSTAIGCKPKKSRNIKTFCRRILFWFTQALFKCWRKFCRSRLIKFLFIESIFCCPSCVYLKNVRVNLLLSFSTNGQKTPFSGGRYVAHVFTDWKWQVWHQFQVWGWVGETGKIWPTPGELNWNGDVRLTFLAAQGLCILSVFYYQNQIVRKSWNSLTRKSRILVESRGFVFVVKDE